MDILGTYNIASLIRAALLLIAGFGLARISRYAVKHFSQQRLSADHTALIQRVVFYAVLIIFLLMALRQLGFSLSVLIGAAGVLSVAVGFASQTAASNLISGLFLLGEKPFSIGDIVKIGDITGEILAVDLISIKIRTFDNLFVRIPNETVMKSTVTTLTRFPIRRLDLKLGVAYKEDIANVRAILEKVAEANPLCLDDPACLFIFTGFGDSALEIQFSVWAVRENFLLLKNSIQEEIKRAFDASDVEIPFPHLSLYAGSMTDPFPVRMMETTDANNK